MTSNQDGFASIPQWYRRWIIRKYGAKTMATLDEIGGYHDTYILLLGHKEANKQMRRDMKQAKLPYWGIRLPVGRALGLYRILPQSLKDKYFNLIE